MLGRKRISQAELARKLGVSGTWVSYRLAGKQPIDLDDLQRMADVLEVTAMSLLTTRQLPASPFAPTNSRPASSAASRPTGRHDQARPGRGRPSNVRRAA